MRSAHYHEIGLAALKITFELRRPASIARAQEPVAERRKVRVSRARGTRERLNVAPTPRIHKAVARARVIPSRNKLNQEQRLALPIVQSGENGLMLGRRFQTDDLFAVGPRAVGDELVHAKVV